MTPLYLDHAASSPLAPEVADAMAPWLSDKFGNPHSDHLTGIAAASAVEHAKDQISSLLACAPDDIIFMSGATEANNLALKGILQSKKIAGRHLIVSAIEHKCVLEAARYLEHVGCDLTVVPPAPNGRVSASHVADAMRDDTALVSVMAVNNETGAIQPFREIAELCADRAVLFHSDAAQAVGRLAIDLSDLPNTLLSLSGHKLSGPQGIGALIAPREVRQQMTPLFHGGGQQGGIRSGTVPTALCVGLGAAASLAQEWRSRDQGHLHDLRADFLRLLRESGCDVELNAGKDTVPGILSVRIPGVDAAELVLTVQESVSISMGSACNAGSIEPSYVLRAMGLPASCANESVRISFGRTSTKEHVNQGVAALVAGIGKIRSRDEGATTISDHGSKLPLPTGRNLQ